MECEICGKNSSLVKARVEGVVMSVCQQCSVKGKIMDIPETIIRKQKEDSIPTITFAYDFKNIVKKSRLAANLTIEELGARINEKASVLRRVESGMNPTVDLAKKLERALKIKIVEVS
jgi:putative transcription factor